MAPSALGGTGITGIYRLKEDIQEIRDEFKDLGLGSEIAYNAAPKSTNKGHGQETSRFTNDNDSIIDEDQSQDILRHTRSNEFNYQLYALQ